MLAHYPRSGLGHICSATDVGVWLRTRPRIMARIESILTGIRGLMRRGAAPSLASMPSGGSDASMEILAHSARHDDCAAAMTWARAHRGAVE